MRPRHRALLIDDHQPLAEATAEFLQAYGLDVKVASTGHEGLAIASTFEPEIVLCDQRLPDMEGVEVAQALRRRPGGSHVVIAIHTAMSETLARGIVVPAGVVIDQILLKPITTDTLDKLVSTLESKNSNMR
jgi:DNA-binding response OmpR family regulator